MSLPNNKPCRSWQDSETTTMQEKTKLTRAQHRFLAGYLPDITHGENSDLATAGREEFIRRVSKMDFDGCDIATKGTQRVALNLHKAGLLSNLDIHLDIAGGWHIYLEFSEAGATALYEIKAKNPELCGPENQD